MTKVTIKDVAREAKVSVGLASLVLNGKESPRCKKTDDVLVAARKLNYIPNESARALRTGYRKTIGVITPNLANHYFGEISRHLENIAYSNGFTILFGSSDDSPEKFGAIVDAFMADGVSGIIATPCEGCSESLELAMKKIPVIIVNRDIDGLMGAGRVLLDNDKAIVMGLEHFSSRGFKHVEMISSDHNISTLIKRQKAYMASTGGRGRINVLKASEGEEKLCRIIEAAKSRGADAIFVPSGYLTIQVFSAIKSMGLNIPEDMALMGFDGGVLFNLVTPSITQVVQQTSQTAQLAYDMLCRMMDSYTKLVRSDGERILIAPLLLVGESSNL